MPPSPDFYTLLSPFFQGIAPSLPAPLVDHHPPESAEGQLWDDLQTALHDHSQQRQAEIAESQAEYGLLQQRMETHIREQATLMEISQILASALELKPGLILDQLREIVDYTHAVLFALHDLQLVALAVRGPQLVAQAMPFHIRLAGPEMLAALLNGHRPMRIADLHMAEPSAILLRKLLARQADVLLTGMHSWMWVPLAVQGRVIGGMSIAHAQLDAFTAHHADLALTMANQAAITMVNAHLYAQAQTLATLEERQRLARNLHDAVNQSLFPAGLIADVLPQLWEQDPAEGRQSLGDLRRLIRGAQAELRGLLAELRPAVLVDTELSILLRQLGDALTGRTNIPVMLTVEGEGPLPADVQMMIYRLCQEALSNVAKHAEASQVMIHLYRNATAVELRIRDDGCGFDPHQSTSGHHGLSIMSERADAVGALLSITSQPGQGTNIVVRWRNGPKEDP